ncbi:hydrogenase maturation nickel metallochaperone HypA [Candidatus Woesearchaeota archaeon]|nr:hydrogenase maturation nickel metallochaperone HypA [Candidatus Woesearchaeota archaeon]
MSVKYKCMNCQYEFSMQSDRNLAGCPYCGKKSLRTLNRGPGFSSKLVDES